VIVRVKGLTEHSLLLGALYCSPVSTRPDIAFSVAYLSRFLKCTTTEKMARARHTVMYSNVTCSFGLRLALHVDSFDADSVHAHCMPSLLESFSFCRAVPAPGVMLSAPLLPPLLFW
jgi:hypothetical protein